MTTTGTPHPHNFQAVNSTPIPELNIVLHQFSHRRTGARYLHIENDDDNNMFAVGFKTTPLNSTGVAHILEHTVLCGSRNYPVRDPFFSMLRRSLNTFMNALTSSDWTLYPFATRNRADFYNLMGVYLDAVFFPLLREEDFRQEGHRLEFSSPYDPSSPLEIKGVVYNEMKGAMADPSSLLSRRLNKTIFPTLTYGYNSGGEPGNIPDLSYRELCDFHANHYHPSNSYFCSYGNLPVEQHLTFIEEHALESFNPLDTEITVPRENRYSAPRQFREPYPVDEMDARKQRGLTQVAWLTAGIEDRKVNTGLNVLASLLIGNPSAPLYRELLSSGLGMNLAPGTGFHDDLRESYFAAGLQGCDPENEHAIEGLIDKTLKQCVRDGFSQGQIDAAIHQLEFSFREVGGDSYPYGLTLLIRLFASWLHCNDPVAPLQNLAVYETIRSSAHKDEYFQHLIRDYLLDNPHRITLTLYPDISLKNTQAQEQLQKLEKIKSELTQPHIDKLIRQARTLNAAQEAPENLDLLPTLDLDDIPADEAPVEGALLDVAGIESWQFSQPTNGITYLNLRFDLSALDLELFPYLPVFCTLLPQLGAAGQDYLTISSRIAAVTGGIRATPQVIEQAGNNSFKPSLEVRSKCLYRNHAEMVSLLLELLTRTDFEDLDRIHQVMKQLCISLENGIPGSGHSYAIRNATSSLTSSGRLKEAWNGIEQMKLVREWSQKTVPELADLAEKMKQISRALITRNGLRTMFTSEPDAMQRFTPELKRFIEGLPSVHEVDSSALQRWEPSDINCRGWIASAPVAYVARVFAATTYTHPDAPLLAVLARLLRAGYLHREIRERGGAYGGLVSNDPLSGVLAMVSYRDPHIKRTLKVFRDAAEWAARGDFSQNDIKEAIISCFSDIDRPNSPAGRAYREFNCLEQGLTRDIRQAYRKGILAAEHSEIMRVARDYLLTGWQNASVSILAGDELMKNESTGLEPALHIERI